MFLSALVAVVISAVEPASTVTYAVLDIANEQGQQTALSSYIGDELSLRYASDSGYSLVERGQLKKVLKEHSLQGSGAIDEATISSMGRLLGASRIITGQYYQLGDEYIAMIRILDVSTGKVLKMAKINFPKSSSTQALAQTITENQNNSTPNAGIPSSQPTQGQGPLTISKCNSVGGNTYCSGIMQASVSGKFDIPQDQEPFFLDDGNVAHFYNFKLGGTDNTRIEIPAGIKTNVEICILGTKKAKEFRTFKLIYSFANKEYKVDGRFSIE